MPSKVCLAILLNFGVGVHVHSHFQFEGESSEGEPQLPILFDRLRMFVANLLCEIESIQLPINIVWSRKNLIPLPIFFVRLRVSSCRSIVCDREVSCSFCQSSRAIENVYLPIVFVKLKTRFAGPYGWESCFLTIHRSLITSFSLDCCCSTVIAQPQVVLPAHSMKPRVICASPMELKFCFPMELRVVFRL